MAYTRQMDSNLSDKEIVRKHLRNAVRLNTPFTDLDIQSEKLQPIPDLVIEFVKNFREAGGKFIPCKPNDLVSKLIQLIQGQHYGNLLNTSPNLGKYLLKYQVPHINAMNPYDPVDAVLVFSDMLIARSGSIAFTQSISRYPSIKNLAKDIIIVSRERCIFQDVEHAMQYHLNRCHGATSMTEFLKPSLPEMINGNPNYTTQNPRFILMMVAEHEPETQEPAD